MSSQPPPTPSPHPGPLGGELLSEEVDLLPIHRLDVGEVRPQLLNLLVPVPNELQRTGVPRLQGRQVPSERHHLQATGRGKTQQACTLASDGST